MSYGKSTLAAIGLVAAFSMVSCSSQDGNGAPTPVENAAGGAATAEKTVTFAVSGMV